MSLLDTSIGRALERLSEDRMDASQLRSLRDHWRTRQPRSEANDAERSARLHFLRDSLGDARAARMMLERVLAGNELQEVNYLVRGAMVARAIARIHLRDESGRTRGWGTGFLIAPNVLLTNNHVLEDANDARLATAEFSYERDIADREVVPTPFTLEPQRLFFTSVDLDFTVVAVADTPLPGSRKRQLSDYGCLPLLSVAGKAMEGEWLTIIQHPGGERKQVCVRENRLMKRTNDVLWYSTDTLGGSSGSPVFNNDWYVVALHHSGVPEERDGKIQTVDGRDFDPATDNESKIKWVANEGIRVTRIVDSLKEQLGSEPLLQPLFAATPASVRADQDAMMVRWVRADPLPAAPNLTSPYATPPESTRPMNAMPRTLHLSLEIDANNQVRLLYSGSKAQESFLSQEEKSKKVKPKPPSFDVPFNASYDDRKGYDPDFLGGSKYRVHLPELSPALLKASAKLINPTDENTNVLHYHNFSVVMHEKRRFALYSAANVRFDQRYDIGRPTDVWREDTRIPLDAQVSNFYYSKNQFDRGHLTRREDLEFGLKQINALQSAADTCHYTNCVPQHEKFNRNKELWQGIERHILEGAILSRELTVQVLTGPILEEDDPAWEVFPKIQYPRRFWKVVATVNSQSKLVATAYILDQSEVIDENGIASKEVLDDPFGGYKTFQVKIAEVERLTHLSFKFGTKKESLSKCDSLVVNPPKAKKSKSSVFESLVPREVPEGYYFLGGLEDIHDD